ncbi:MAG TPA: ABC transporter substrate-binding protein [Solirubrobacterales bacterium]|nr:ABC transporter substrate-binding protein [Solirubrobacterales bacterium]
MRSLAALLAAVLVAIAVAGCDDDGAEPGASKEATLVLDFQPNAVHSGIYTALRRGYFEDEGFDLTVREPSSSTDAPQLLEAGRADFAVLDINDYGIALERGVELTPVAAVVQRPLAAVIAGDREQVVRPRDLEGGTVGVTGLPSDDAVLDAVLQADGADPSSVERVTIGFDSVAALSAGRVDAATAFWNAEGVTLRRLGVPTREFRIDDYGAEEYPELLVVRAADGDDADGFRSAMLAGYRELARDPEGALEALLAEVPGLDAAEQRAQFEALAGARAFGDGRPKPGDIRNWLRFASEHGIVDAEP